MSDLPNADRAFVDRAKIVDYLLCHGHPRGAPKAAFFEQFGFSVSSWQQFRDALCAHATANPVDRAFRTTFGEMFEIISPLSAPDGRRPMVLVV
jgi:hypothetical protein